MTLVEIVTCQFASVYYRVILSVFRSISTATPMTRTLVLWFCHLKKNLPQKTNHRLGLFSGDSLKVSYWQKYVQVRPGKNIVVFQVPCRKKLGWVGQYNFFLLLFFFFNLSIFIPHHTKSGGVLCYTLRTLSVHPSVRPSVHLSVRSKILQIWS